MNLLNQPWIPVQRANGATESIAPWQITESENPIIRLAAPRHDYDGALAQFLIGLLQTAAPPKDGQQWEAWLDSPPSPDTLKSHFSQYEAAFELDGDGPRFMQDIEAFEGEEKPISGLLIEAPGNRTSTLFLDHFIKDGNHNGLCQCCAATALFTLQTNAPSGGVGHRTSLRGGGPLTTLVVADIGAGEDPLPDTLWTQLWLNVLDQKAMNGVSGNSALSADANIFPWLVATRTSEAKTGVATTPEDAHPLQMYWAMPRRIRLEWQSEKPGQCDLCGAQSQSLVTSYTTRNYGTNYNGAWQHPLSPHYQDKKSGEMLPIHAQPDGLVYRHWLAWTQGDDRCLPARVVREYQNRKLEHEQLRLWAFGYDMDNMKARGWHEKFYPLYMLENDVVRKIFFGRAAQMISLSTQVAGFVQGCVKDAWFSPGAEVRGETAFIKDAFFQQTEAVFFSELNALKNQLKEGDGREALQRWHGRLAHHALKLFDHWASRGDVTVADPRRIAEAYRKLRNMIYGKKLLQTLGIESGKEVAA